MHPDAWEKQMFEILTAAMDGSILDIEVGDTELKVVAAASQESHIAGLSQHEELPNDGMLFMYHEDHDSPFTRKDMNFDIDIRFFDKDGELVACNAYDPEFTLTVAEPGGSYRYVLETSPRELSGRLAIKSVYSSLSGSGN